MAQASPASFEEKPMASTNRYPGLEPRLIELVRRNARRLAALDHRLEQEEVEQELLLHLHTQTERHETRRGSRATFEDRVVRNRAASLARDARAAKRGHPAATVSFDEVVAEESSHGVGELSDRTPLCRLMSETGTAWEDGAALRLDLMRFLAAQPGRARECCLLLLERSVAETARIIGRHRSSIYAWLTILRSEARSAGLDIYIGTNPTDSVPAE
jgi:hypothetical protein